MRARSPPADAHRPVPVPPHRAHSRRAPREGRARWSRRSGACRRGGARRRRHGGGWAPGSALLSPRSRRTICTAGLAALERAVPGPSRRRRSISLVGVGRASSILAPSPPSKVSTSAPSAPAAAGRSTPTSSAVARASVPSLPQGASGTSRAQKGQAPGASVASTGAPPSAPAGRSRTVRSSPSSSTGPTMCPPPSSASAPPAAAPSSAAADSGTGARRGQALTPGLEGRGQCDRLVVLGAATAVGADVAAEVVVVGHQVPWITPVASRGQHQVIEAGGLQVGRDQPGPGEDLPAQGPGVGGDQRHEARLAQESAGRDQGNVCAARARPAA